MVYKDRTVTYNYSVDNINNELSSQKENLKHSMLYMLKAEISLSGETKEFFQNIVEIDGKVIYKYKSKNGDSYSVELTTKDIEEALK